MSSAASPFEKFTSLARLFPLPNLVLFPHVIQPLHIFEPRYRQMARDALAGDRLITLVLLQPGWETSYEGRPPLHEVACVGRIIAEQALDDGRFNLLVRGEDRARIIQEVETDKPYRSARMDLLQDVAMSNAEREQSLRQELTAHAPAAFTAAGALLEQLEKLLQSDLTLGALCDILAFALPLEVEVKQQFLQELDVESRARNLLDRLRPAPDRRFPPDFSSN